MGTTFDLLSISAPDSGADCSNRSPSAGQYSLDINTLASSQVLASGGFSSASTAVGTGTLHKGWHLHTPSGTSGNYSGFSVDASKTVSITITRPTIR